RLPSISHSLRTTMRAANLFRARARQTSGPMHAGSPEVTAMIGTEFERDAMLARDAARFSSRALTVLLPVSRCRRGRAAGAAIPDRPRHPFYRELPYAPRCACAPRTCPRYAARALE